MMTDKQFIKALRKQNKYFELAFKYKRFFLYSLYCHKKSLKYAKIVTEYNTYQLKTWEKDLQKQLKINQ